MSLQDLVDRFIASGSKLSSIQDQVPQLTDSEFFKLLQMIDTAQAERRRKLYQYLVTFTTDPARHPEEPKEKVESYIESQVDRPALKITEASYVAEKHVSGRTHWHMKLVTTKPLRSDAFNKYEKYYGKVDISRSKHTNGQHIDIYLNKENTPKKLKG